MVKRNVQQNLQALQADDAATGEYAGEDGSQVPGESEYDQDDWALYDEEERQFQAALAMSQQEAAAMPMDAAAEEDARCREEAELLHAIAMSLQIQEEAARLEQAAQLPPPAPVPEPAPAASPAAFPAAAAPGASADWLQAEPKSLHTTLPAKVPLKPSADLGERVTDHRMLPELRVAPPETRARAQEVVQKPWTSNTVIADPAQKPRTNNIVISDAPEAKPAPAPPAAPAAPDQPAQPSDEEKARRAEHLRRQRELLLAKKTAERQKQLEQYERMKGTSAASAGAAAAPPSQNLVSELTIAAPAEPLPENAVKAQQMRNALTQQLKQTLVAAGTGQQL